MRIKKIGSEGDTKLQGPINFPIMALILRNLYYGNLAPGKN